jgi:hypothetical protein
MKNKDALACLAICCSAVAIFFALFSAFVVRIRLYDSTGVYKGTANVGTLPIYLAIVCLCFCALVWLIGRRVVK